MSNYTYRRNLENKRKKTELEEINSESFLQLFKHVSPQIIKSKWVPSKINFKNPQIFCNKAAEPHRKRVNLITDRKNKMDYCQEMIFFTDKFPRAKTKYWKIKNCILEAWE